MFCSKCGAALADNAVTCEKCGRNIDGGNVIAYDYITAIAEGSEAYEVMDGYRALGWEVVDKSYGAINMRRNRRIKNKEQLNRLQAKLDDGFNSIRVMEKNKTQSATVVALILGIVGALIFGGGMSLCIAWSNPAVWMYIAGGILAAIGAVTCCLSYFVYTKIRIKNTAKINVQIEKKRDEICGICEDGQKFLASHKTQGE